MAKDPADLLAAGETWQQRVAFVVETMREVSRHEDPHDRRVRRVELTEAGRRLTTEIIEAGTGGYIRLLRHLDTETLRTMETVMRKIEDAMREMHADDAGTA